MRLAAISFEARIGNTLSEQTKNCIDQLTIYFNNNLSLSTGIVSLNFFIAADNNEDFYLKREEIIHCLSPDIRTTIPAAYLAQPPANKAEISLEVHYLPEPELVRLTPKNESGVHYVVAEDGAGKKMVFTGGISPEKSFGDTARDAEWVFGVMKKILDKEGLDFSCIFRQWNYIEGIVDIDQLDCIKCQHYQLFNDVRSKYYSTAEFRCGFPAATGIGTRAGGVVVSFYASDPRGMQINSLENPFQRSAFEYTEEVLVGDAAYTEKIKTTPKFSRAKYVKNTLSSQVYISGTASIKEENTVGINDVILQTKVTIENIKKLIQIDTIARVDESVTTAPTVEFYRVYIKNPADYEVVKELCENHFPGAENIFVVSDICRGNLLVEIEALASSVSTSV